MLIALLVLAGLCLSIFGVVRLFQWKRMQGAYRQWPSVDGAVLSSSLRVAQRLNDDNAQYDVWQPKVAYRYAVAGAPLEGARAFWFDREFSDRTEADSWLADHSAGATRPVFYDPASPGRSALALNQPDAAPGSALIWLGLLLAVGAILSPAFGA